MSDKDKPLLGVISHSLEKDRIDSVVFGEVAVTANAVWQK